MPNAMLISYDYAPMGSPGAMRVTNLARHLPRLGWKATVITPSNGVSVAASGLESLVELKGVSVVRSRELRPPARQIRNLSISGSKKGSQRRIAALLRQLVFPDRTIGWYPAAVRSAIRTAREVKPDVIYSTYPEITNHFIASRVSKRLRVPWVMEYRDPWSPRCLPKWNQAGVSHSKIRNKLEAYFERKFFDTATLAVVVTDPMAVEYAAMYENHSQKLRVVHNGYDETCFSHFSDLENKFTLTHAGSLYGGNRNPEPLLRAIQELSDSICSPDKFRLRMIGNSEPNVASTVDKLGLNGVVEFTGRLTYQETARYLMRSHVNLIIDQGIGNLPTKVFDYIGSRRPILALCPAASEVARFVREHGLGLTIDPKTDSVDQIMRELTSISNSFAPPTTTLFTRAVAAEKLAKLFEQCTP